MSLDPTSSVLSQIENLISSLNKRTAKTVTNDLQNLVQVWGRESEVHFLRCLLSAVDVNGDNRTPLKETAHSQLLKEFFLSNVSKAGFTTTFCIAFDTQPKTSKLAGVSLAQICKSLRLSRVFEVAFGLVLFHSSKNETRVGSVEFLKKKLPELLTCHCNPDTSRETGIYDCSAELIHHLLFSISKSSTQFGLSTDLVTSFIETLKKDFPQLRVPVVISPYLYSNTEGLLDVPYERTTTMDAPIVKGSLALQVQEIGYGFCSNMEVCQNHLSALGVHDITPSNIAHVLAMMVRTHSTLKGSGAPMADSSWLDEKRDSDELVTWKVEVFVQVLLEMAPMLNWNEVVAELDHPGFAVKDRPGLILLTRALLTGLRDVPFPINILYNLWTNKDGQLFWIQQILRNPDVFCFTDYPHRFVQTQLQTQSQTLDVIKLTPEDTKEVLTWKSLDLIDILLALGDVPGLSNFVNECFRIPIQACPELLALGLMQTTAPMSQIRQNLLLGLFQMLFPSQQSKENRMNLFLYALSASLSSQSQIRQYVLHSIAEWYNNNGEVYDRLTKVLQLAIKLKILWELLKLPQYSFVIDLACLASKCDYVNLNRWFTEKVASNGEPFVQACVQFLKRRCPGLVSVASANDPRQASQLQTETVHSILTCLQTVVNNVSPTLGNEIVQMCAQFRNLVTQTTPGNGSGSSAAPGASLPSSGSSSLLTIRNASQPQQQQPPTPGYNTKIIQAFGVTDSSFPTSLSTPSSFSKLDQTIGGSSMHGGGPSFSMGGDFGSSGGSGGHSNIFGNQSFSQQASGQVSPSSGLVRSTPYNESASASLLRPVVTGWGAGFAASSVSTSNPMMSANRPISLPQAPVGAGGGGLGAGGGGTETPSLDVTQTFPDDVQDEANSYFQQIYTQPPQPSMSIEQFLEVMKRFRDSQEKKQRDVFACMIKNLFEEYNFFEQYPDKELQTTALLFGGVVRENLLSEFWLTVALRFILESLRKEPNTKLFIFGTIALEQFKRRLKEFPGICYRIMSLPLYSQLPAKLVEYIQYGAKSELPPSQPTAPAPSMRSDTPSSADVSQRFAIQPPAAPSSTLLAATPNVLLPASRTSTTPSLSQTPGSTSAAATPAKPAPTLNSTNIDTLVTATSKEDSKVAVPAESIVEKVAFLFNNLSQMNMVEKVNEMKTLIDDEHLPWLAQYLVMKRVSAESNFHNLYANFVTALNNKLLNSLVLKETYRNIRILLRSDKAAANFSDRTLLKNLGHWLGMISLGINKPIYQKDLNIKWLLLEAFWKGQQELLYVVPFVAKILESCQKCKIFKPPNPWTLAILNVLAELHTEPDLKLNLKFEIEVLCRHLNVEIVQLKNTHILKDPNLMERSIKEGQQLSNPPRLERPTMQPSPLPPANAGGLINQSIPVADDSVGGGAAAASAVTPTPTVARFSYHDIYVNSFQGLTPHISVNAALPLFQLNPPLKNLVRPAIEHAVHELIKPVADRAIKVAMTTTENVIKKDFALDSDDSRMRLAAQNMARSLTAGMAMITCRDPLQYGMQGYLKQAFYSSLRGATTEQQRMIEEAVQAITEDNVELAQCFIVKSAAERAVGEIDKVLAGEFDNRHQARKEGRQFFDQQAAKFQTERMPDSIRLKIGLVTPQQISVYEEFGKSVPGFKQATAEELFPPFQSSSTSSSTGARQFWPPTSAGHIEDEVVFQQLLRDIDARLPMVQPHLQNAPACLGLAALREALAMASQNPRDTVTAQTLVQKLVDVLLQYYMPRLFAAAAASSNVGEHDWKEWNQVLSEAFLAAMKNLSYIFGVPWVQKQVTKTLIDCRQESRFNVDAVDLLIRSQLVNMVTYDLQLADSMENGINFRAVDFAQHLVRRCFVEERSSSLNENDLSNTIDMLTRISSTRIAPEGPSTLMDLVRSQQQASDFPGNFAASASSRSAASLADFGFNPAQQQASNQPFGQNLLATNTSNVLSQLGVTPQVAARPPGRGPFFAHLESGVSNVREYAGDDPPGLQDKAEYLLREWVNMHHTPAAAKDPSKVFSAIVSQMHQHGILKSDDLITRFFRLCTEMCVDLCYRALSGPASSNPPDVIRARCFHTLDAFVRLIALLVKHSGDGQVTTKLSLLNKVLGIIAGVLLQDHEIRRGDFHQLPFHRILITLFLELTAPDPLLEPIQMQILEAFCNTLHAIRPQRNPSFTFAWLDIIGHRAFIGRVLVLTANQKAWSMYARLLIDHLHFLAPFLRNIEFQKPITLVYKGTLRILLVLLHDLPELLCDFHYALCDVIPPNCVQLRNLILSAYPRNMRLPDPFMPNLKVDQLTEINTSPRVAVNFSQIIQPATTKNDLDMYLKNRAPVSFLSELRSKLQVSNEPGQKYNIPLINAIVLYVGTQAIQAIQAKDQRPSISTIAHTAHMDIFQNLAVDLDTEGRYLFFNAIANQLRYPNSHTHYFSCTLLYLFAEANSEAIQEQITRILFERLVALRPHPWGLLITFIELIKNPYYKFWTHQFVRCAPEIENLFESVARSCMAKHVNEAP